MSSDEEDFTTRLPGPRRYGVVVKDWRSDELTRCLRYCDALNRFHRSPQGQGPMRGQFPRSRFLTDKSETSRRAVPGLPRGAYNPVWLETLSSTQLHDLRIKEVDYNFSHTQQLQQYVDIKKAYTDLIVLTSLLAPGT